jgi:DNA-binding response OmpR family regulator
VSATILLIDYDPCSICRIRGILSGAGLQAIVAEDGVAGIEAFERHRPDLTLVQDLVPRKHGFEVCAELKKTEHGKVSPVVLLAHVRIGRRHAVLSTGCDDYVEKPLDGRILLEKIRRLLPPPEPSAERRDVLPAPESAPSRKPRRSRRSRRASLDPRGVTSS